MDIHRCRFVDYPPSAINALAFSHTFRAKQESVPLRLAVGRANGNIEIWNPQDGDWIHEITLYGGQGRSVDGLAWVRDPDVVDDDTGATTPGRLRLFSSGFSSEITEWDLVSGLPLQKSTGSHSEIWCIAAQPAFKCSNKGLPTEGAKAQEQDIVAGCADGSIVQFSTQDGELSFKRFVAKASSKKARVISIAFQGRDRIVAGYSNSTIRVYDIRSLQQLRTIAIGRSVPGAPKDTLIWAVECLADGTIVSGDSTGEVAFWDAKNFGQIQRIKAHESDVLCLASSQDGTTVFSAGMDRRTCIYQAHGYGSSRRYNMGRHKRIHDHDVKAMARFDSKEMGALVSGGLDCAPVLIPLRNFQSENHRTLPFTPQLPPLTGSNRLVVSWWENQIGVWRIDPRRSEDGEGAASNYKEVLRMSLKNEEHLTSVDVSADGSLLASSTTSGTKLFTLESRQVSGSSQVVAAKLDTQKILSKRGSRLTRISPDSKWLLTINSSDDIRVYRVALDTTTGRRSIMDQYVVLERSEREERPEDGLNGQWGCYESVVTRAVFSPDSRLIAVSDLGGCIDTWSLRGHAEPSAPAVAKTQTIRNGTDSDSDSDSCDDEAGASGVSFFGQSWTLNQALPRLHAMPLTLCFRQSPGQMAPSSQANGNHVPFDDRLLVLTSTHKLFELHATQGQLTEWSRRNGPSRLPDEFQLQRERATGSIWEAARERLWVYSAAWVCMFDLSRDFPVRSAASSSALVRKRKRRESSGIDLDPRESKRQLQSQLQSQKHTRGGAGSKTKEAELGGGVAEKGFRELNDKGKRTFVRTENGDAALDDEDEEEEDDDDDKDDAAEEQGTVAKPEDEDEQGPRSFYLTTRYRPILGVVPLSVPGASLQAVNGDADRAAAPRAPLEVAVIERPLHQVDLGPRHAGREKWDE